MITLPKKARMLPTGRQGVPCSGLANVTHDETTDSQPGAPAPQHNGINDSGFNLVAMPETSLTISDRWRHNGLVPSVGLAVGPEFQQRFAGDGISKGHEERTAGDIETM
jgi:hypothetical protein